MGRYCSDCGNWKTNSNYSGNQWRKGDGNSRCSDCVHGGRGYNNNYGGGIIYQCHQCNRTFNTQNELNMHMQVHRPRDVACPVCGERRFRSGANAVQHVESGYCSGCRGRDNARNNIWKFATSQSAMQPYLTSTPMLTNGGFQDGTTPDFPYYCNECNRQFRQLSQLLQHNDQKHGHRRMLGIKVLIAYEETYVSATYDWSLMGYTARMVCLVQVSVCKSRF